MHIHRFGPNPKGAHKKKKKKLTCMNHCDPRTVYLIDKAMLEITETQRERQTGREFIKTHYRLNMGVTVVSPGRRL